MQDKPDSAVLIVGCGDVGRRVAALRQSPRCSPVCIVRSGESLSALREAGFDARRIDLDAEDYGSGLPSGIAEIFYFAPPPSAGKTDTRMTRFLQKLQREDPPRRMVYISTSAVYGDCGGAWISEERPPAPATDRGWRRLDAERQLMDWCGAAGCEWTLLRVPGIYGPGKLPLARLRQGLPVLREADAPYTNRIHVDDLAAICVAAMSSQHSNTTYNVSDGHPGNMTDYFFRVADAAGLPRPPEVSREEAQLILSPGMLSFLNDSRRMDNTRMLDELEITLRYPDLDAGLASCF
ncbi:MAG TPA: SDR family oxidoreductase [Gammaproteobacteria bacterium]|nr:SDR family oxidoreductase [Gammaproteobacteria bacterium]